MTESVLAGSAVHVQCHAEVSAWRILTASDAMRHKSAIASPVTWRPWTGDLTSVLGIGLTRKREGSKERWWVLVGELPSPDAIVEPMVGDGQLPEVRIIQGRLWACEWSGRPSTVEATVDGKLAFLKDFAARSYPLFAPEPPDLPLGNATTGIENASTNSLEGGPCWNAKLPGC
jgi:hypothetical protein